MCTTDGTIVVYVISSIWLKTHAVEYITFWGISQGTYMSRKL